MEEGHEPSPLKEIAKLKAQKAKLSDSLAKLGGEKLFETYGRLEEIDAQIAQAEERIASSGPGKMIGDYTLRKSRGPESPLKRKRD